MLTDADLEDLTDEELQAMGADDASICRDDFAEFVRRFWFLVPGAGELIWSWHIQLFCDELAVIAHRVQKGEDKLYDLVLNVSPGTSKSTVWSILFPAWVWTFFPQCRILTASHTDQLALDLANKARTVIKSELYRKYYPEIILRTDQDTKGYYANTFGGDRFTCTVSGKSPIGFHGHILIIDDPIDPKKVLSEASLRTAREFITTVLPSRKVNKAVTVTCLIMQRLGVGDPTEVMLENSKKEGAAKVRHICLPADLLPLPDGGWDGADVIPQELAVHYREGLMDPSRLSRTALAEAKSRGPHYYETQFRQKPYSRFGGMFQPAFFNNRVKAAPRDALRIRYWDRAATSIDQDGCATAGVLMAKDAEGNYYVEHVVTGHWLPKQRNDRIKAAALRDRSRYGPKNEPKTVIEAERGSTGLESFQNIARLLAGFRVEEDRPSGSKVVRAEPWSDACASGIVYIVDDGTWDVAAYVDEHCAFPLGKLLDQTDASCLVAGTMVETSTGSRSIEDIRAGEFVLTRQGYREVQWAGQVGVASKLVTVQFDNGAVLTGTPEHLVWTQNRTWVRLDSLSGADYAVVLPEQGGLSCRVLKNGCDQNRANTSVAVGAAGLYVSKSIIGNGGFRDTSEDTARGIRALKSSSSTGFYTPGSRATTIFGGVSGLIHCTAPSGGFTTETSLTGIASITRTTIQATIPQTILNASRPRSIVRGIQGGGSLKNKSSIWRVYGRRQRHGTALLKDLRGIKRSERKAGRAERRERSRVLSAVVCFGPERRSSSIVQASVLNNTAPRLVCVKSRRNVRSVDRNSWGIVGPVVAQENVGRRGGGPTSGVPVYDLKVADVHEFFANGILVHNSGAFNLLAKTAPVGELRVLSFDTSAKLKHPRLVVCDREHLPTILAEQRTLLLEFRQPPPVQEETTTPPPHALTNLLDSLTLTFADINTADYQEQWNSPVEPYGKPPADLVMTREHGKKIWAWLLKKREPVPEVYFLVDDGTRVAESVAKGVADVLRIPRSTIYFAVTGGDADTVVSGDSPAPNGYVYDMTRAARGAVL